MQRKIVFRVRPWRAPRVYRDLELLEQQTLHDLHRAIQTAFDLDDDHLYAFYLNNNAFDREFEYSGPRETNSPQEARETELASLQLKVNKHFLYLFDFGDELRHEVRVLEYAESEPETSYPRECGGEGEAPRQYPFSDFDDPEDDENPESEALAPGFEENADEVSPNVRQALESMVPEIRRAAAAGRRRRGHWLDSDELPDEDELLNSKFDEQPLGPEGLKRDFDLAIRLLDGAEGNTAAIERVLKAAIEENVIDWLHGLPDDLSDAGLNREAVALCERLRSADTGLPPIVHFPLFLLRLGRHDEAVATVQATMLHFPDEPRLLSIAAEVQQELGHSEAAITHYQEALRWAGSNQTLRAKIVTALVKLYEQAGRAAESVQLRLREQQLERKWRPSWTLPPGTVRRDSKIGRNQPCPCGSNKKYKKCCGKPS